MPELPEVETVRRGLTRFVVGRRIGAVEVRRERTVRRTSRQALIDGLTGRTITAANRRGKYLLCTLDSGNVLMVHLRMSGALLLAKRDAARLPHTHVILKLAPSRSRHLVEQELWFVDPRTFGEMVVYDPACVDTEVPEVARLGVDPLVDHLSTTALSKRLANRRGALKPLLLNQHVLAGIGNIYADEILHAAGLHPARAINRLKSGDVGRLHRAIAKVLSAAISAGGSTLKDARYVDLMGNGGSYQDDHRVYGREGERCRTCRRGTVRRILSGGRSTFFCPVCQRLR